MAIQIPNPGTGNGATGDNEFVLWTKVINNFSDQTNAASKLVGDSSQQVPTGADIGSSYGKNWISGTFLGTDSDSTKLPMGAVVVYTPSYPLLAASLPMDRPVVSTSTITGAGLLQFCYPTVNSTQNNIFYRTLPSNSSPRAWIKLYHTGNTSIVNGNLKPSSPVVKVHTNSLELNGDAEKMGVTLNKRGVGDYLLQNTTGLRDDGGWRIELPQDVNGNPYFAVEYNELENNDIEVKTYKRIFDMSTFMFVPDLDSPVDIKEGSSIAIRFNDLHQEMPDDTQTEV